MTYEVNEVTVNEGVYEEPKLYTVFNYTMALQAPYSRSDEVSGERVLPVYLEIPNAPRASICGSMGIVTGIYGEAPECTHLSQTEAEELMLTEEWTLPEAQ